MSKVTSRVSSYIRNRGINISKMARDTGFSYMALYDSLMNDERDRDLRDEEFFGFVASSDAGRKGGGINVGIQKGVGCITNKSGICGKSGKQSVL